MNIIKYFGGKGNLRDKIIRHFPMTVEYHTYVEPFGGSFSVGLKKPVCPIEIFNDLDKNVYSLYKVISDKSLFKKFKKRLDLSLYSEDLRKECEENLKQKGLNELERAFNFFYVNRTSFHGVGGFDWSFKYLRRGMCVAVSNYLSTVEGLNDFHERMSRVVIMNRDGLKIIEDLKDKERVFLYCDPPYVLSTRGESRYSIDWSDEDHDRFLELIKDSKCKILISGYDNDKYNDVLSGNWNKKNLDEESKEVIWRNYNDFGSNSTLFGENNYAV